MMIFSLPMQSQIWKTLTTKYFVIRYERNVSQSAIQDINDGLTSAYLEYAKKFGGHHNKWDVHIFSTVSAYKSKSRTRIFDDGDVTDGIIYLTVPKTLEQKAKFRTDVSKRLIIRALLEQIPALPRWLAESYALYIAGDIDRFGDPARYNIASFYDLSEDYNHASEKKDVKELYAKLAATAKFLINRYGDVKVESMLRSFKGGGTIEEVFESSFNEKISDIEKAWVNALQNPEK